MRLAQPRDEEKAAARIKKGGGDRIDTQTIASALTTAPHSAGVTRFERRWKFAAIASQLTIRRLEWGGAGGSNLISLANEDSARHAKFFAEFTNIDAKIGLS